MLRNDLELPQGFRVYGIADIVLNYLCAGRLGSSSTKTVFFSGVVAASGPGHGDQARRDLTFTFPDKSTGDPHELVECVLGYTIWHLVEDIPIVLATSRRSSG